MRNASPWSVILLVAALFLAAGRVSAQTINVPPDMIPGGRNSDAEATLIVFNLNDPASADLAIFYQQRRGIPKQNMIGLRCSVQEEITRQEYDSTIAEPLRKAFTANFWWKLREPDSPLGPVEWNKIRFVALMRGVPLKISAAKDYPGDKPSGPAPISGQNEAAVDSELSLLGLPHPISGAVPNQYFRSFSRFAEANRPEMMLVCRLDAPTPQIVKRMIIDSLNAEKNGLYGFAYIDARGITGDGGGLKEGDDWLLSAANTARRKGMPVILDNGPGLFPDGYPMRNAALYLGWYTDQVSGTFKQLGFEFPAGAIAVHIHSFSALTLREPRKQWAGPLLEAGAAATLGNVYEPYLGLTPRLDTFAERLLSGFTFAESAYMSMRALSWMTTIVGDPLYRPFPVMDIEKPKPNEWTAYADGARKWFGQSREAGAAALKASGNAMKSGVIFEGLGLLQLTANNQPEALQAFRLARQFYTKPQDYNRVAIHEVVLLRAMKRENEAIALAKKLIADNPDSPVASVFQMICPELAAKPPAQVSR